MIERDKGSPSIRATAGALKTGFEIIRNSLTVATLGFFYQKTQSNVLMWAYYISLNMLTAYITALAVDFRFLRSYFADTIQGQMFGLVISMIVFFIIGAVASQLVVAVVHEAVKVQFK
jgi:hypothetical protein